MYHTMKSGRSEYADLDFTAVPSSSGRMASFTNLTTVQLRQALQLREQIESLQQKLEALFAGAGTSTGTKPKSKPSRTAGKRRMSAEARANMAAAQQARRAKVKTPVSSAKTTPKKKRVLTAEGRARIAAAMKARWAAKKGGAATE